MKDNNIVIVDFTKEPNPYITGDLFAFDYGQQLRLIAPDMPDYAEVHFSWHRTDKGAITQVGVKDGDDLLVTIPEFIIAKESNHDYFFHVWLYSETAPHSAESAYHARLRVIARAKPVYYAGMPFNPFSDVLRKIRNWIDNVVTPKAKVEDIDGGHRLTVTDATGTTTADIPDGKDAKIDDTLSVVGYAAEAYATGFGIRQLQTKATNLEVKTSNLEEYNEQTGYYVTPQMFGAVADGVADDTEALQAAIDFGIENNKKVILDGLYLITSTIEVKGTRVTADNFGSDIEGNSRTHIIVGNSLDHVFKLVPYTQSTAYGIKLKNIIIDGHNRAINGIYSENAVSECEFENLTINQCENGIFINANCYLNTFKNVRPYHCSNYGIKFDNGNNTSNVFEKCYCDTCPNAFKINGQYSTMISCCADNCTGVVFDLSSFTGVLIACGSEATTFEKMFKIGRYSNVVVLGGMFFGNPNLSDFYISVDLGSNLNIKNARLNYNTVDMNSGALISVAYGAHVEISDCNIQKTFPGQNSIDNNSYYYETSKNILTKTESVTLDENNEWNPGINPTNFTILSVVPTNRSGWLAFPYCYGSTAYRIKVVSPSNFTPTISDKEFTFRVIYIENKYL